MKSLNLCLHAGGHLVNTDEIGNITLPPATDTYRPINHKTLRDLVATTLSNNNMKIVQEQSALAKEGQRYFGLMQISNCKTTGDDFAFVIGLRNSIDKQFPASLAVGSSVFVCDNLAFSGEIKLSRKHTQNIERDLPEITNRAIGMLSEKWTSMVERYDAYKNTQITDITANDIIIRSLTAKAITTTQIPYIVEEWKNPRHEEFKMNGNSVWRLFNACTESAKGTSIFALPRRTIGLHAILDASCGIISLEDATKTIAETKVELN